MNKNKPIGVSLEREVQIMPIVTDLTRLLGCTAYERKNFVTVQNMGIENYWIGRGDLPVEEPLYQISCRGIAQQGQEYLEKAYRIEVSTLFGEPISEELEARVIGIIRKAPSD